MKHHLSVQRLSVKRNLAIKAHCNRNNVLIFIIASIVNVMIVVFTNVFVIAISNIRGTIINILISE